MFRLSLFAGFVALATRTSSAPTDNELFVKTTSGPVEGFYNDTAPDVRQFLGIPYAEPPIGNLRFAPPEDKRPTGTIEAKKLPPSCLQRLSAPSPDSALAGSDSRARVGGAVPWRGYS